MRPQSHNHVGNPSLYGATPSRATVNAQADRARNLTGSAQRIAIALPAMAMSTCSEYPLAGHEAFDILLAVTAGTDAFGHLYARKNAFHGELINKPQ